MKALLKELWEFAKNPNEEKYENYSIKHKFLLLGKILLLDFGFVLIIAPLLYLFHDSISEYIDISSTFDTFSNSFLFGVFIIPILEEFFFRLPLKYEHNLFAILLNKIFKNKFKFYWTKYYKFIFYFFVILFGAVHLTNYTNFNLNILWLSPVLILSQTFGGFTLSFLRIRIGLIWSILSHSSFNFLLIISSFLFLHEVDLINISNEEIDVFRITNLEFKQNKAYFFFKIETDDHLTHITAQNYEFEKVLDSLEIDGNLLDKSKMIDLKFRSDVGLTRDEIKEILIKEEIIE